MNAALQLGDIDKVETLIEELPDGLDKRQTRRLDRLRGQREKVNAAAKQMLEGERLLAEGAFKEAKKSFNEAARSHKRLDEETRARENVIKLEGKIAAGLESIKKEEERLAAREFISISPNGLYKKLIFASSWEEVWDKRYAEKFIRWSVKFYSKDRGILNQFTVQAGNELDVKCATLDENFSRERLDGYEKWERLKLEGKLSGMKKLPGTTRMTIVLSDCRIP